MERRESEICAKENQKLENFEKYKMMKKKSFLKIKINKNLVNIQKVK